MRIILTLLILTNTQIFAQSTNYQHWEWVKSFGGSGEDSSIDMKIRNGNLYVTGTFSSSQINWENNILNNAGGKDIFIAKLDTNGNTKWVKAFGGFGNDYVTQIESNASGTTVLLCKSASDQIKIGSKTLTNPQNFFIELDDAGNIINSQLLKEVVSQYEDVDIDDLGAIYVSGAYKGLFTFAGESLDTSFSKSGSAIFKYLSNGTEAWVRYIPCFNQMHFPGDPWDSYGWENNEKVTASMKIEYSNFDKSISFLCYNIANYVVLNKIRPNDPVFTSNLSNRYLSGRFLDAGILTYLSDSSYPYGGSFGGRVDYFKSGLNGLNFSGYQYRSLSNVQYHIRRDYNDTRKISKQWIVSNFFPNNTIPPPYENTTLKLSEQGSYLIANNTSFPNKIEIVDSNINQLLETTIPSFGNQQWIHKCMNETNAVYLAETYTNSKLNLNAGLPNSNTISISNNGSSDIFVGKYNTKGKTSISLGPTPTTYKICRDSVNAYIPIIDSGAGNLKYHWQPSANLSDANVLQPMVFTTDTITRTLTITDSSGASFSQDFVFFKGKAINLRISVSDTIACPGDTLTLRVAGDTFSRCMYNFYPYQNVISSSNSSYMSFTTINDSSKYILYSSHVITLYEAGDPFRPLSPYCINSQPVSVVAKDVYQKNDTANVCFASNYTFPDGYVVNNIVYNMTHESHINSVNYCDSIINTAVLVSSNAASNETENIEICPGTAYTFPDGMSYYNIYKDTTHYSRFNAINGCDSTIRTNLRLKNLTKETGEIVKICKGSNYTFPDGVVQTNITSPIKHTSHFKSENGCDTLILETSIELIQFDTTVTRNDFVLIANDEQSDYRWLNCLKGSYIQNAIQKEYTVIEAGSYAVTLSKEGCIDTSTCYVFNKSEFPNVRISWITLYPMPVKNELTIEIQEFSPSKIELTLVNVYGKKILKDELSLQSGKNIIKKNIGFLQNGVYFLSILKKETNQLTTRKIIIQ